MRILGLALGAAGSERVDEGVRGAGLGFCVVGIHTCTG